MSDKADWSDANLRHFIDICKWEIEVGNRPNGTFTRNGWKNLSTKYEEKNWYEASKETIEEQVGQYEKAIYMVYGVEEFCHWTRME
jgi:hypothetical protein